MKQYGRRNRVEIISEVEKILDVEYTQFERSVRDELNKKLEQLSEAHRQMVDNEQQILQEKTDRLAALNQQRSDCQEKVNALKNKINILDRKQFKINI